MVALQQPVPKALLIGIDVAVDEAGTNLRRSNAETCSPMSAFSGETTTLTRRRRTAGS